MNPTDPRLLAELEADIAAHGRPAVSDADVARTAAAVKAALATPTVPQQRVILCTDCFALLAPNGTCPNCDPEPLLVDEPPAAPAPDNALLEAAERALPVLGALASNPAVRPIFNALYDAAQRARGK